jgi:hypothetical protein
MKKKIHESSRGTIWEKKGYHCEGRKDNVMRSEYDQSTLHKYMKMSQ